VPCTNTIVKWYRLYRQIIKSDYASITFPEIDFEIPPKTQQGEITTVEGLLSTAATRLGYEQQHRMETDPTVGLAVAEVISKVITHNRSYTTNEALAKDSITANSDGRSITAVAW
jgi:C4-type Zn-finger protein